jgi:mRNA-degrading endonuclease RelE of RelBE toxin-antitoxin system
VTRYGPSSTWGRPTVGTTSEWDWKLTDTARRDFEGLDEYARDRIASKLDGIVTDQWRDPPAHLEPLEGAPHQKLRVGPFRLGCRADRNARVLYVLRIRKRGGDAYRGDDD